MKLVTAPRTPLDLARIAALRAAALVVSVSLTGCAAIGSFTNSIVSATSALFSPQPVAPNWKSLVISAADDSNLNSPVALDIVFVKDQAMVDALLNTPSGKWFSTRTDLQRSFPAALSVVSLELVPKQSLQVGKKALEANRGYAAIVFADYPGPGEHRERLQLNTPGYVVQLGTRGFRVAEVKTP